MTESTSVSGTLTRTSKRLDTVHHHYFNSFQNYCCGPKSRSTSSPSNKEHLPIPERFKVQSNEILNIINQLLIERLSEITQFTSVLPHGFFDRDDLTESQRYLIDSPMFKMMYETQVINWMSSLKKLYPVRTSGNGNCLLHAVLIAMVGVHDFDLYLRDRLRHFMEKNKAVLKGIWRTERIRTDKMYGIQSEDSKLDIEWEELCDLVRYENSDNGQTASSFQFLEAVHIFSICNMLRRPIIVLSEDVVRNKHGEAIAYNDLFGIYLPTLEKARDCVVIPIVLAYDQSHFCPLQANDLNSGTTQDNFLPLYQSSEHARNQRLLPIRFLDREDNLELNNKLLQSYLRIKKLAYYPDLKSQPINIICAELGIKSLRERDSFLALYYEYVLDFIETEKKKKQNGEDIQRQQQEYSSSNQPSYNNGQGTLSEQDSVSPPPYSLVATRFNDNRNQLSHERRASYDKAVSNGETYTSSNNRYSEAQNLQKPQTHVYIKHDNHHQSNGKSTVLASEWDSTNDDLMSNGKTTINNNNSPRGNESKLKQGSEPHRSLTRIPVTYVKNEFSKPHFIDFEPHLNQLHVCYGCHHYFSSLSSAGLCAECDDDRKYPISRYAKSDSSSNNLIDFDQKTDRIRPCIICKMNFHDLQSTGLCSNCDYNRIRLLPRQVAPIRPSPLGVYPTSYSSSDFISPVSSSSKMKGQIKITCSQCRSINLLHGIAYGANRCSICQNVLNVPHY
ncbi:unnamed protein product [Rotaria magnacalcarata]|uniref:OTU domain-containing protein n=1 Tax=Rotaria magnacalcarata TaxID=392030 RepID=A0A816S5D6_9BILA|nr:unnamed protein product [Rotaria magnacalcarata]CAF2077693.1 unnamed protein product [Rotaria magnacalcarata]CAF3864190.1 unnamed protein product [Rotaria magnacalcarata]CAF3911097.1 unnamed protein product [Rotaria magnacalcarata]